ncbi:MAG: sigma-70 family RNA polymerase sigma factor [Planctomycetes bacterium]|nr:sigma-70 family RNA polymerase sigma factor [Planctomycetota bacterium]
MSEEGFENVDVDRLLGLWRNGDQNAFTELVERSIPWIEGVIRKRMDTTLRQRMETQDALQDTLKNFLRYGPGAAIETREQFFALLRTVAANALGERRRHFGAGRRDVERERPLVERSDATQDVPSPRPTTPSLAASRNERRDLLHLALESLDPTDAAIIRLRTYENLTYPQIAEAMSMHPDVVAKRYQRAMIKLSAKVGALGRELRDQ